MYRLMIVEDEQAIAQGIANSLPWEEWGFQISRVCSNGEEALEAIAVEMSGLGAFRYPHAENGRA